METSAQNRVLDSLARAEGVALAESLVRAVNAHDVSALTDMYAGDATLVSPALDRVIGRAAIGETWRAIFGRFPDWQVELTDTLVDGNRLAIMGFCHATDRNGWFGLPPTGAPFSYRAVVLLTFDRGKIVRDERVYDLSALLQNFEKARVDRELKTAAEVQHALLSRRPWRANAYEIAGDSIACRTIGGDFFEYIDLPNQDLAVVLGDVSGKGPAAALLAAMLQGIFSVDAPRASGPAAALRRANEVLVERRLETQFATVVYAVLRADGRLVYSNAGHSPPMLLSGGEIKRLTTGGPILGAFREAEFQEESIQLRPNETLVMFTDGITEATDRSGEEFGEQRLVASLRNSHGLPPQEIVRTVLDAARAHSHGVEQFDDMTVAAARFLRA